MLLEKYEIRDSACGYLCELFRVLLIDDPSYLSVDFACFDVHSCLPQLTNDDAQGYLRSLSVLSWSSSFMKLRKLASNRRVKMRRSRKALLIAAAMVLSLPSHTDLAHLSLKAQTQVSKVNYLPITAGDYRIDSAHSIIGFAIRHFEISWVEGRFKDYTGTIRYDDKDITKSSVEFTAKVESIDTGVEARDKHLRSADFFEVEKYPEMSFKSSRVERKGKEFVLHGDLTLKGVTKQVALPFTITGAIKDARGNTRFGVEAQTRINRRDYGINFGGALANGGFDIGNEVTIKLHLEALQPAPKPAAE